MNEVRFLKKITLAASILFLLSCGDSSENGDGGSSGQGNNLQGSGLYCDFGPITQYGGGCFEISNASECDTEWGSVVTSCSNGGGNNNPSSSSTPRPSSSSASPPSSSSASPPNALEITLTKYKELSSLDPIGYGDPRVSFRVRAYQQRTLHNNSTTKLLLNKEDVQEWTGTAKDTVTISVSADSVLVEPIVKDADALSDDDYSPNGYAIRNFINGTTHNALESKNNYVSVTYNLRFIRR